MAYRSDEEAHRARVAQLERRAAEADDLEQKLERISAENKQLKERVADLEQRNADVERLLHKSEEPSRYQAMVASLRRLLGDEHDDRERVEILLKLAYLYEKKMADLAGARRAYQEVLEIDADNPRARAFLGV